MLLKRRPFSLPINALLRNAHGRTFILLFVFSVLVMGLLRKIDDYDIWHHLSIGRSIYQTLHIPKTEFLVYPMLGEAVSHHEWGYGLFFFAVYRWFGYWGMSLFNALIGVGSLVFVYLAAEKDRRINPVSILTLSLLIPLVSFRFIYRPEMFLFLFLGAGIYLLERFDCDNRCRWLLPLPIFGFLLSLVHPSTFFLLTVVVFYAVQFIVDAPQKGLRTSRLGIILCLTILSVFLAGAVNPYGFDQVLLPFKTLKEKQLVQMNEEFFPILSMSYKWHFILVCISGLIALVFEQRRRVADWLLFVFFGYLAFLHVRNLALFAIVMYVPVTRFLIHWAGRTPLFGTAKGTVLSILAACSLIIVLGDHFSGANWGAGPYDDLFPAKAARKISELKPAGKIFNYHHLGGYLGWELYGDYLVSVDGRRLGMDKSMVLHNDVFDQTAGWKKILENYEVGVIVTPATYVFFGSIIPLVPLLADDEDWLLVAAEPAGLLFFKRGAARGLKYEEVLDKKLVWRQVVEEAGGILRAYPTHASAYLAMGQAYLRLEDFREAAETYRKYLKLNPGDRDAMQIVSTIETMGVGTRR